ncbi:MAG: PHP domain-containing protein, partial [Dehalococcoidia bacterium]|nr:PHP domain-containing protein [Dehalococcoidia bacterium]
MIIDLHVHTVRGSSDSALRLTELIDQCRAIGLPAVCVTEHDHLWHDPRFVDQARDAGLLVTHGIEVSTEYGHILAYGLPAYLSGIHRLATLRREADRHGAVLFAAHPFRRAFEKGPMRHNKLGLWFPSVEEAAAHPVFGMV